MNNWYDVNGDGGGNDHMKPEPGRILKTEGKVPLRFLVLNHRDEDMLLYCSARDGLITVNVDEFMELENPSVIKMTVQQIEEQVNYETARLAKQISEVPS